ncbi:VOC family protein [Microbacterium sp. F2E]|uniref:VOC family protein n=1 Tax=Microbacterium sp. F2E TaxID=2895284 RepID=UPI001E49DECD|nr:VOC family protein [Microbacterium sp. F2E]MCC9054828.1 VOC family protein [Microbacterium sp. F2E]
MTGITPYLHFDGTARAALEFYRDVFGGEIVLHTSAELGRDDGPADAVAHGMLQGPVELFASDTAPGEETTVLRGIQFATFVADGGVLDPLALKPWGDHDGQVRDRFGVTWLIGYQG